MGLFSSRRSAAPVLNTANDDTESFQCPICGRKVTVNYSAIERFDKYKYIKTRKWAEEQDLCGKKLYEKVPVPPLAPTDLDAYQIPQIMDGQYICKSHMHELEDREFLHYLRPDDFRSRILLDRYGGIMADEFRENVSYGNLSIDLQHGLIAFYGGKDYDYLFLNTDLTYDYHPVWPGNAESHGFSRIFMHPDGDLDFDSRNYIDALQIVDAHFYEDFSREAGGSGYITTENGVSTSSGRLYLLLVLSCPKMALRIDVTSLNDVRVSARYDSSTGDLRIMRSEQSEETIRSREAINRALHSVIKDQTHVLRNRVTEAAFLFDYQEITKDLLSSGKNIKVSDFYPVLAKRRDVLLMQDPGDLSPEAYARKINRAFVTLVYAVSRRDCRENIPLDYRSFGMLFDAKDRREAFRNFTLLDAFSEASLRAVKEYGIPNEAVTDYIHRVRDRVRNARFPDDDRDNWNLTARYIAESEAKKFVRGQ